MALTVQTIIDDFNTYVGDPSTDRITAAQRLEYVTEATIWLQENLKNDHQVKSYDLQYIDTVNYYQVTTQLADLLDGADLRRRVGQNYYAMTHKSPREMAEEVAQQITGDDSWGIERRDNDVFLVINATPRNRAIMIDNFDSGVSHWVADTVNSDMSNIRQDLNEYYGGSASLAFDLIAAQSANNRATMTSTGITMNLSTLDNTGVFLLDVFIPDATFTTSYTLRWGSDSSNYWTTTVTTDINGNAFQEGWQVLAFEWQIATKVGSPVDTSISYFRVDLNFSASQANAVFYRYDTFRVAKPETLSFNYVSFIVGTDSSLNDIYRFAATTDIPFFSGKYDQYRKAVAHMAASSALGDIRLKDESTSEESAATEALGRAMRIFPQSITKEVKSFKVRGNNLARRNVGRNSLRRLQF